MPVFISYSQEDRLIVEKLAVDLVKNNARIWVDIWELNVGDSILNKVQDAIQESSALLVILSKTSVESEWCKKELAAGLMRELEEKRVVVLPVLVEDCEIPMFLREKMYADLRVDFKGGVRRILNAIGKVTNAYQGRFQEDDANIDWSEDWGFNNGLFHLRFTIVEISKSLQMTFLTQVNIFCNEIATNRYRQYEASGIDWIGRDIIAEFLWEFSTKESIQVFLDSQFPKEIKAKLTDSKTNAEYDVIIESRKMGQDNGKDQLLYVGNYLLRIRDYVRSVSRKPTPEEVLRMQEIMAKPPNA